MARRALFSGLVVDEDDAPVDEVVIGDEAFYVVDDEGFRRHIESEAVDRQVLQRLKSLMEGNEELISQGAMQMMGQEDIFTKAMIETSLKKMDAHFEELIARGLPDEARAWLGMVGFRVVIDVHGTVQHVEQPSAPDDERE